MHRVGRPGRESVRCLVSMMILGVVTPAHAKPVAVRAFNLNGAALYSIHKNGQPAAGVVTSMAGVAAFRLDASVGDGVGFAWSEDLQPPAPPVMSSFATEDPGCALATWLPSGDPTVVGYVVSYGRQSVAMGEASAYEQSVFVSGASHNICLLPKGRYYTAVRARNAGGLESPYSQELSVDIIVVSVTIAAFDVRLTPAGVRLAWRVDADEPVLGYRVYREARDGRRPVSVAGEIAHTASSFVDESVAPNTTYTYQLAAIKENGDEVLSVAVSVTTPALAFVLAQNMPNPFTPSTTIAFTIPEASRVAVHVYDVRGRQVATVYEGTLSAGNHALSWDGGDDAGRPVASGAYFYALTAGTRTLSRKLTVLR